MTDPSIATPGAQITAAMIIVWLIQELKKSGRFPGITVDTVKVNRIVSAIGALATGAAIHWTWDSAAHSLLITGLTGWALLSFFWSFLQQFVGQEMLYQLIYAPKEAARQATATAVLAQAITVDQAAKTVAHAIEDNSSIGENK